MKSPVVKRSIVVAGHKTSVSLEEAFWNGMKEISGLRDMTLSELVGEIDSNRQQGNLSSAIRLFVLDYFRSRAMPATTEKRNRDRFLVSAAINRETRCRYLRRPRDDDVLGIADFRLLINRSQLAPVSSRDRNECDPPRPPVYGEA